MSEKPQEHFHVPFIFYNQVNISVLQLNCEAFPWEKREVFLVHGKLFFHIVDVLPENPETRAEASINDALNIRDLAAGLRFDIFILIFELFDLFSEIVPIKL